METKLLIYNIGYITSAIVVISLGLFVFFHNKKSIVNRNFLWLSISAFIHALIMLTASNLDNQETAHLIWYGNLNNIFLAIFFTLWIFTFIDKLKEKRNILVTIYTIGLSIFILCVVFPKLFLPQVIPKMYLKYYLDAGPLYSVMVAYFILVSSYTLYHLIKAHNQADKAMKNRIKYVIIGVTFALIVGSFAFFLVYNVQIDPLFTGFFGLYTISFAYAIVRHQLMDIRMVIRKALIYSIIIALISGGIIVVSFLSHWFDENIPGFQFWTVPLIAGFAAFIIGRLFWNKSREVDKLKYEFVTVAAHKLRTPLTQIKWAATILTEKAVSDKKKKDLVTGILSADSRLIELTNELLVVSKDETNQYVYKFQPVQLEEITRELLKSLQDQMAEKNIKLILNIETGLPKINADYLRMTSVIQALLENAVMYTKDEIKISIKQARDKIVFSVQDNGIGIDKKDQEHIFLRFFRTSGAYLANTEGVGIGLFIAKNIIERHNGKIGVISEGEGRGSDFWFKLKI